MTELEIYAAIEFAEDVTRQTPGRLRGVLVTYGERAIDRPDVFEAGALSWPEGGFVLNLQHNRQLPIARITPYQDGNRLLVDAALPNTTAGRDAAENVRQGVLTGLSVEVGRQGLRFAMRGGVRHITAGQILGAGLVDQAAFASAIVDVHAARRGGDLRAVLRWL